MDVQPHAASDLALITVTSLTFFLSVRSVHLSFLFSLPYRLFYKSHFRLYHYYLFLLPSSQAIFSSAIGTACFHGNPAVWFILTLSSLASQYLSCVGRGSGDADDGKNASQHDARIFSALLQRFSLTARQPITSFELWNSGNCTCLLSACRRELEPHK